MAIGSPQWMYKSGEAYQIEQSLKLDDSKGGFLSRTPSSGGNRRTYTISTWIKRGTISNGSIVVSGANNNYVFRFRFNGAALHAYDYHGGSNQFQWVLQSNNQLRDTSAWYHVLLAVDTTQATNTNRIKMYVNGSQITNLGISNYPAQNYQSYINDVEKIWIGETISEDSAMDGYLAELNFIDGQALTPADFGETGTYGEWKPIEYEGTYGTNGFYLPFKNDYTVEGFSTVTYKGNGTYGNYIGGTGFNPDIIWIKPRSLADHHQFYDSVRGFQHQFKTNSANAEDVTSKVLSATDGTYLTTTDQNLNSSSHTYVGWHWDMGANTPTGFGCVAYKGANVVNQVVTGFNFSPDLLWIKSRTNGDSNHLFDKLRGAGRRIRSDSDSAEDNGNDSMRDFLPDGFKLGVTGTGITVNASNYVAWGWDMGGTSVSNTDGTLTSTVMANPTYGQSIVKYTGVAGVSNATKVGHGLNSAPEMIILKVLGEAEYWPVWHKDMHSDGGFDRKMYLNDTGGVSGTDQRRVTSVSSTTFGLAEGASTGGYSEANQIGEEHIAYCFHSVSGYSKFGTYTGDATTNHSKSVTLGFRPAFLMVKKTSGTGNWVMVDNVRNPMSNDVDKYVKADTNDAEATQSGELFKFTSTGFTIGANLGDVNANGATYIYMAFAGGMDSISDYNTTGSSDSRVKANTTYGQSIVTYTGQSGAQTIGHGLSSAPEMIIAKNRSSAQEWLVYHHSITDAKDKYLRLDTTGAVADNTFWNDTAPTSSVFSVGDSQPINSGHGNNYVAYCFHSVTGYSKFGTYNGDGTHNGSNAVNCGFEPAFVMIKCTNDAEAWWIFDNVRNPLNGGEDPKRIAANESNAEVTGGSTGSDWVEFTSTGFKMTGQGGGTNGGSGQVYVYMAFADKREYAYWLDQSGNNNDWTSNNLTESDISLDSPTNNFCTINPLTRLGVTGSNTQGFAEGNLMMDESSNGWSCYGGTHLMPSGKYYYEMYMAGSGTVDVNMGAVVNDFNRGSNAGIDTTGAYSLYAGSTGNGTKYDNSGSGTGMGTGYHFTWGDIVQVAYDADSGKMWLGKNNIYLGSGNPATGANPFLTVSATNKGKLIPAFSQYHSTSEIIANFGQDSSFAGYRIAQGNQDGNDIGDFYYTPPTGFLALCTKNLPDATVTPQEHFNTVLYTGTGNTSTNAITGVGFQPDLVWTKNREDTYFHTLYDAVRGTGNTKAIHSNDTASEGTHSAHNNLASFDSNGFTLGTTSSTSVQNYYDHIYVAWNWKAGTSVSGNTTGSGDDIAYTGSVNTDAGFSIIKYAGNNTAGHQIPHHLGVVPDAIFIKSLTSQSWNCFFPNTSLGATKGLQLDNTGAANTVSHLNNTMPSTSVVTLGTGAGTNTKDGDDNPQPYIMYSWANKDGYVKVGSYTGNGSQDGPFVYTGFRPAFVMVKSSSMSNSETNWVIWDNERNGYNTTGNVQVFANQSWAEGQRDDNGGAGISDLDILSNGFKHRDSTWAQNGQNGATFIYIAFAETPFKYSNAR